MNNQNTIVAVLHGQPVNATTGCEAARAGLKGLKPQNSISGLFADIGLMQVVDFWSILAYSHKKSEGGAWPKGTPGERKGEHHKRPVLQTAPADNGGGNAQVIDF